MPQLTPAQRLYIRKKTKVYEPDPSELGGELNIIPFLDIVVNLIMFLLVSTITAIAVMQIQSQLPKSGGAGGRGVAEKPLNLNVIITDNGVIVTGSAGKLAPGCERVVSGAAMTVPKTKKGYGWDELTGCLERVKKEFPDESQVTLTADPTITYDHVVAAMDAVRSNRKKEELFPDIILSAGIR